MILRKAICVALGATTLVAALPFANANPNPLPPRPVPPVYHPPGNPYPNDPNVDRLANQRNQIQSVTYRLFNSISSFYRLARQQSQTQRVVYDRYNGRRSVTVTDPSQQRALSATGQLANAASQFSTFQARFNSCGAYERQNSACDRSLNRELSLLRNLRGAFANFRAHVNELASSRNYNGQQLITESTNGVLTLAQIYRQAGLVDARPIPRPVPPIPGPRPQPQPQPLPLPRPPGDNTGRLQQARSLADQLASQARAVQQAVSQFRSDQNETQAIEAIDALVLSAEQLVNQLREQDFENSKFAAQETEVQFNATRATIQISLQRSNNLTAADQALGQMTNPIAQLASLFGLNDNTGGNRQPPGSTPVPDGYGPGDKPPYAL